MKYAIILIFALASVPLCRAQVKFQPFISDAVSVSRLNSTKSDALTAGLALIVPVSKKFFVRPFVGAGKSFAINPRVSTPSIPIFQPGALIGYHATKRFSPLAGFAESMSFPRNAANFYLPTMVVSTATRIHGHWSIFTPFTLNSRSYCIAVQLGYTK